MKIVLYSGGQQKSNQLLHRSVVELAWKKRHKRTGLSLTYLPFCSDNSDFFYRRAIKRYQAYGVEKFQCLIADTSPSRSQIEEALKSDILYLAGGNTFYFLKHLRESGILRRLKNFAETGGVLAGLSAGGLILSPTTQLAAYPALGPDENDVGLTNFKGLGLFPFEFSPHFEPTPKQIKAHLGYSTRTRNPVYAVEDGSGVVINGDQIKIVGKVNLFYRGMQQG